MNDTYFIFYVPGMMGSLLSILIKSQVEKNFQFKGFSDNTAHDYAQDAFLNTHTYSQYIDFKKKNIPIEKHLTENYKKNESLLQRCDINWANSFIHKNLKCTIAYIGNLDCKIRNFIKMRDIYPQMKDFVNEYQNEFNFKIDATHKNYEKILLLKYIIWCINQEEKYKKLFNSIDLFPIIKNKNFENFEKVCKITNKKILYSIVDSYNNNQKNVIGHKDTLEFVEKYIKLHQIEA